MSRDDMKFDVRALKYRIRRNEISAKELEKHLAALPDDASEAETTNTGFVDEGGISLGSNEVRHLKAPRVLLMWDSPTSSLSAGWARYVLERRFHQPVSAIRIATLRSASSTT